MKKLLSKPGFESIFALSIAAIIGLPPLVLAQDKKEKKDTYVKKSFEIRIKDGDTVINGKNLREMSGKEREDALTRVMPNGEINIFTPGDKKQRHVIIKRKGKGDAKDIVIERSFEPGDDFHAFADGEVFVDTDSLGKDIRVNLKRFGEHPPMAFNYQLGNDQFFREGKRFTIGRHFDEFDSRNSQSFNYTNTDDEGISTHVSYRINDARDEKLKDIADVEKAELGLKDINLSPEFSTGKTTLSFNLPAKTNADIQFKDSQGKVIWSDKATAGNFSKSFSLPMNGVYYLQVKQGSNVAVKRIVKED